MLDKKMMISNFSMLAVLMAIGAQTRFSAHGWNLKPLPFAPASSLLSLSSPVCSSLRRQPSLKKRDWLQFGDRDRVLSRSGLHVVINRGDGGEETEEPPPVSGDPSSSYSSSSPSSSGLHSIIPLASSGASQLVSAFAALDESDQYDSVLTSLCAKMLDSTATVPASTAARDDQQPQRVQAQASPLTLADPIKLLQEMNDRRIEASPRSIMALIDATVKTQDAQSMARVLSICSRNRCGITQYGILQTSITPFPDLTSNEKVICPDGTRKTRQERLNALPAVPADDRAIEVSSALTVLACFGLGFTADVFALDDVTPYANTILFGLTVVGVVDNFYDVLQWGINVLGSAISNSNMQKKKNNKDENNFISSNIVDSIKLPDKESLPFGLGEGKVTGTVVRGLTRLFTVDAERECECEASALYVAYTLGLPCFAFRPNALEAACLVAESMPQKQQVLASEGRVKKGDANGKNNSSLDPLLSSSGILKVMIWLMAPVAMESMKHPQLINSDPREVEGFLQRLKERKGNLFSSSSDFKDIEWLFDGDDKDSKDFIKWAYTEADVLLRNNMDDVKTISQQLSSGAATIGDCIAAVEKWY